MPNSIERIALLEAGVPEYIKKLREKSKELRFHLYGSNSSDFIKKVDGYETDKQHEFRLRNFVSNKSLCEKLLNPATAIFSAKGGSIDIDLTSNSSKKQLLKYLTKMSNGMSLDNYIQTIIFDKFISDPAGLILTILNKENNQIIPVPEFHSIDSIFNYNITGMQPNWVIFEPIPENELMEMIIRAIIKKLHIHNRTKMQK